MGHWEVLVKTLKGYTPIVKPTNDIVAYLPKPLAKPARTTEEIENSQARYSK